MASSAEIQNLLETNPWWKEISDELDRVCMVKHLSEKIPIEHKIEVIEALLEYLFISEEDLRFMQYDPIFEEAKSIISALNPGSKFPQRLIELFALKIPGVLDQISKTAVTLIQLISDKTIRNQVELLWTANRSAFENLDIKALPSYLNAQTPDDRYIIRSIIELQHLEVRFRSNNLYPFGSKVFTPVSLSEGNELQEPLLPTKERARHLAYRVVNPLWDFQMTRFEPEYVTFRLKWINDAQLITKLYKQHKAGKDVAAIFISIFTNENRLNSLKNAISSCPVIQEYSALFAEAIDSYRDGRYRVCAAALLPLIEGIIWEFAWWWNKVNGDLFDRKISRAEYKDMQFHLRKKDNSIIGNRPNIGILLRQTKFSDDIYFEVIEYLVSELFAERNSVLHGRVPNYGSKEKAASLVFVVETLERQITKAIKEHLGNEIINSVHAAKFKMIKQ